MNPEQAARQAQHLPKPGAEGEKNKRTDRLAYVAASSQTGDCGPAGWPPCGEHQLPVLCYIPPTTCSLSKCVCRCLSEISVDRPEIGLSHDSKSWNYLCVDTLLETSGDELGTERISTGTTHGPNSEERERKMGSSSDDSSDDEFAAPHNKDVGFVAVRSHHILS